MMDSAGAGSTAYEKTVDQLIRAQRGAFENLGYVPVFRASGLFRVVKRPDLNTYLTFLNYWQLKNGNSYVGAVLNIRDGQGRLVKRSYFHVDRYVYCLDIGGQIPEVVTFAGTAELEFFSSLDLKFAFPAVTVMYESKRGISYVHTNQRVYNNAEDQSRSSPFDPWQTGFDVYLGEREASFVAVNNGPYELDAVAAELVAYKADGTPRTFVVDLGGLKPYASLDVDLEHTPGLAEFLGAERGFVKANLSLPGVYNRFLAGTKSGGGDWLAVTHTYYDCRDHHDYYDLSAFAADVLPCFVPINLVEGLEVEAVFYPILAPAVLDFRLEYCPTPGVTAATIDVQQPLDMSTQRTTRIDLRRVLREHGVDSPAGMCCIHLLPRGDRLPARIKFGLNYYSGGMAPQSGTNICSSVLLASSHGIKHRSWLWGPLPARAGGRNVIMISHYAKEKSNRESADVSVRIYDADGVAGSRTFQLPNRGGVNVDAEALLSRPVHDDGALWYVVESVNPSLISNQVFISREGYVGGDHSY